MTETEMDGGAERTLLLSAPTELSLLIGSGQEVDAVTCDGPT